MADLPPDLNPTRVVTYRTIRALQQMIRTLGQESTSTDAPSSLDPLQQAAAINRYNLILEKLEAEAVGTSEDVLVSVEDREVSLLQSRIAEEAEAGRPLPAGGLEAQFGEGPTGGDIWGWFRSVFQHIDERRWHPIVRPPNDHAGAMADSGRVAVVGDWGTNLYGAPVSARTIERTGGYELLLHLGDIYYSGTRSETKQRFIDAWPKGAGKVSRALNGNHEMYSGGFAYFDDILPAFDQASSYFAMQNEDWLFVGLDSAHIDHQLDGEQVRWLYQVVENAGARKLILFSHHQPFSRLDRRGPALQDALAGLLARKAVTAWYWGHEHECILYDRHPQWGMLGRCIGHGGIPTPRKKIVRQARTERRLAAVTWQRLDADADSPSCLVLDGPNPLVVGEEEKFAPHGFLTLDFDGPALIERVHLPDGDVIFEQSIF